MPIEVKELIVRAWVDSQGDCDTDPEEVALKGNELPEFQAEILEQLKRMMTDKKDR